MSAPSLLRVIVPMKPASEGKSRLAGVLDPHSRSVLCLVMLQHVLRTVSKTKMPLDAWVIGGDEWVRGVALTESARWQKENNGGGLNGAIGRAANQAFQDGVPGVLVLPGDLALLKPNEVDMIVALSGGLRRLVLAQAADGGTNAILMPRGLTIRPLFGRASFTKHMKAAQEAGIPVAVAEAPGLSFDLDTPKDLEYYRTVNPNLDYALAEWKQKMVALSSANSEARRGRP